MESLHVVEGDLRQAVSFFSVVTFELRASHRLGKYSTIELYCQFTGVFCLFDVFSL